MAQLTLFEEVARANQDEATLDPAHVRKAQMEASWVYQRDCMVRHWLDWWFQAMCCGDADKAMHCLARLAHVESI